MAASCSRSAVKACALLAAALALRQAWALRRAVTCARHLGMAASEQQRDATGMRLLMVGDSTGVGIGANTPERTLAGLLATALDAPIENRCVSGARVADVVAQLDAARTASPFRYHLVIIVAGANDALRGTPVATLECSAQEVLHRARLAGASVVWIGCADVGIAPALVPPLSWWLGWRCRHVMRTIGRRVRSSGADFVDFTAAPYTAHFRASRRHYFAVDGLHPSAAAYRECFEVVRKLPAIARLAAARAPHGWPRSD
jgi:lysophospholipase L1-like esterase